MSVLNAAIPYRFMEIDYYALREAIFDAFTLQYGSQMIKDVDLVHFNPDLIEVTVEAQNPQPEMRSYAFSLSEELRRQGLQVGIHVLQ